jgi:hypothetical protein
VTVLVNQANPSTMETTLRDVETAAGAIGLQFRVLQRVPLIVVHSPNA